MNTDVALRSIRAIVRSRLPDPSYRVFLFGSRATGAARKFSDVDVGIQGNRAIDAVTLEYIREDLENSDIPYKVDVVDFATVAPSFKTLALKRIQQL